jgi:hypothetical protein
VRHAPTNYKWPLRAFGILHCTGSMQHVTWQKFGTWHACMACSAFRKCLNKGIFKSEDVVSSVFAPLFGQPYRVDIHMPEGCLNVNGLYDWPNVSNTSSYAALLRDVGIIHCTSALGGSNALWPRCIHTLLLYIHAGESMEQRREGKFMCAILSSMPLLPFSKIVLSLIFHLSLHRLTA